MNRIKDKITPVEGKLKEQQERLMITNELADVYGKYNFFNIIILSFNSFFIFITFLLDC